MSDKKDLFEYIVHSISNWNFNKKGDLFAGLNKLKIIKLHFFICAASSEKGDEQDLLSTFSNFYAMPFGHVESDIYNRINYDDLQFYNISKQGITEKSNYIEENLNISFSDKELVDRTIEKLTKETLLIEYSAFDLVELSHRWSSWISIFNYAKSQGKYSEPIPIEIIRNEQKLFSL